MEDLVRTLPAVFAGRRVLVTGDTGFKGSWLSFWLSALGAEVTGYALPPEGDAPLFERLGLAGRIRHVDGDVRDLDAVRATLAAARPEVVIHLAAQALVRRAYAEPKYTFDVNLGGSVNVLEAVRGEPAVKALVYITSDKCYRNKEWVWGYRETDELGGHDPYSGSKAAAEMAFAAYRDSFLEARPGLGVASVRAGNVIGGGDYAADRIVPDCVRALKAGRPIVLRSPGATRPWQHVLEPLSGYLVTAARLLAEPKRYSGSYNFGPAGESVLTVKELADDVVAAWGAGAVVVDPPRDAPHEAGLLQLSIDKARQVLGWAPRWEARRCVAETVRWYRAVEREGADPVAVTAAQIAAYVEGGR